MDSSILIFLFVGGVYASLHFSIESANGFQSFRPIGKFQQHVSHAHFGVELHFGVFEEQVNGLRKTVSSLDETKVSPYLKSTFARLAAMIDELHPNFTNTSISFWEMATECRRDKPCCLLASPLVQRLCMSCKIWTIPLTR